MILWQLIFIIVMQSGFLFAKQELSVCAIFQDEAPWLREWLDFHLLQGVEHFYLYNNNSQDSFREVLDPYIARGRVTLSQWPYVYKEGIHKDWIAIQTGAYMDCIRRYGEDSTWMAFIDIDEFLFCPDGKLLPEFLEEFKKYGGLGVNWLKFGTSGVEEIAPNRLMIEQLTRCLKHDHRENRFIKSIVQPKHVLGCPSAHYFSYKEGKFAVGADKKKIPPNKMRKRPIILNSIRINHYITRTVRYFREVKIPSRHKRRARYTPEFQMALAERLNEFSDRSILQFVEPMKRLKRYQ